jgi:hypothetical protein
MKVGTDVQAILRFCLCNFRGCNIGHTDERDLSSMKWDGLRCHHLNTRFNKVWFMNSKVDAGGETHADRQQSDFISLHSLIQNKESRLEGVTEYEIGSACSTNGEKRNVYIMLVGKPEGKSPLGRPRRSWVENSKMDLREIELDRSGSG